MNQFGAPGDLFFGGQGFILGFCFFLNFIFKFYFFVSFISIIIIYLFYIEFVLPR
jgi:hypothetical protein